jgi:hypothetical protein
VTSGSATAYRDFFNDITWDYWDNNGYKWCHNRERGNGCTGFLADIDDIQYYLATVGFKAIFRGHQDQKNCCKVTTLGDDDPVSITTIQSLFPAGQLGNGIAMKSFIVKDQRPPVFTTTTAAEARNLPNEGFYKVKTARKFDDWVLYPCMYDLPDSMRMRHNKYVHINSMDPIAKTVTFAWEVTSPLDFTALNDLIVRDSCQKMVAQLHILKNKLDELAQQLAALQDKTKPASKGWFFF